MFGVINTTGGVALRTGVAVSSNVGVGDFIPTNVGVNVKVRVGVIGVAVGMGVSVLVGIADGVGVAAEPRENPPIEQAKDKTAQTRR